MSTRKTTLFYVLLIAVASMAIGMVIASRLDLAPGSSAQTMATAPPMNSTPITGPVDATTFRNIAKAQTPTVVNIRTESRRRTQELTDFFGGDDFLRRFFGQPEDDSGQRRTPREETTRGAGTGFIIDKSGLILTNNHVVEGATKIEVGFFGEDNGTFYEARVVGRDPLTDSALIELTEKPSHPLPEARFGDSSLMQPGDWVMAIGNPFNFAHTVTVGVISATERPFPVAEGRTQDVLQTDAAINPGNSGGPLLNLRGEVIGINTAILANERASNLGIGFAVPINAVRELLPELRRGKVTRGRIGVQITRVPPEAAEAFGLKDRSGAIVSTVDQNGPARKAGIQPGDVIVQYDGKPVRNSDELVDMVVRTKPGTTVPVQVLRDKQPMTLDVTVEELDLDVEGGNETAREGQTPGGFGLTLENLTSDLARQLRMPAGATGALVTDVERDSAAEGIVVRGDVILQVNRQPVSGAADAVRLLQRVQSRQPAFLLLWRQGTEVFVTVLKD
jgi:serine protease Do